MIDAGRERMVREGWDLAVVLTDVPLRIGRRPVVADASATHGVALASLPALGAVQLRRRTRDAIARLVDGLMGESLQMGRREAERGRRRVGRRLAGSPGPSGASSPTTRASTCAWWLPSCAAICASSPGWCAPTVRGG
jgi:hypothetical protein